MRQQSKRLGSEISLAADPGYGSMVCSGLKRGPRATEVTQRRFWDQALCYSVKSIYWSSMTDGLFTVQGTEQGQSSSKAARKTGCPTEIKAMGEYEGINQKKRDMDCGREYTRRKRSILEGPSPGMTSEQKAERREGDSQRAC